MELTDKQSRARQYRLSHKDKFREYSKKWDRLHAEQKREINRRYRMNNGHKKRAYYLANMEQHRISCRKSNTKNPETRKRYYLANKEKLYQSGWKNHLKKKYQITVEQYNSLLEQQAGVCAICGNNGGKRRLHVDHSHSTGKVRGLLCRSCNKGIGFFRDDAQLMVNAIEYLCP